MSRRMLSRKPAATPAPSGTYATQAALAAGLAAGVQAKRVEAFQPTPFRGTHRPSFPAVGLRGASNLSVDGAGAIIATTLLTVGTGRIDLPATLDPTQPFRLGGVLEVGTDDGGTLDISLGDGAGGAYGATWTAKGAGVTGYAPVATSATGSLSNSMFSGQSLTAGVYEFFAVGDGTRIQVGMKPLATGVLGSTTQAGSGTWVSGAENHLNMAATATNFTGSTLAWSSVSSLRIRNSSKTTKLRSVYVDQAGLAAPTPSVGTGFTFMPTVATATPSLADIGVAVRGRGYDGRTPVDLITVGHPNASDRLTHHDKAVLTALVDAGFLLLFVQGDSTGSLTSANSSDWGNTAGALTRKAALDWTLARFPQIRSVQWLGMSMGCLTGLAFHQQYPGILRSLAGFAGVTNLSHAYSTGGFSAVINTAHGSSVVADVLDDDPNLKPSVYAALPMKFWHGTSDSTVAKASHADLFAPAVVTAGGSASVVSVTGGGHLDTAFWNGITAADVVTFFQSHATD